MKWVVVALRLVVGATVIAALVGQLNASVDYAHSHGANATTVVVNFFSFFTVDSNTLTVVILVLGAFLLASRADQEPGWFTVFRASVTTYMAITGVVYNLLLRGNIPQGATLAWSNEILHVIGPLYVVLDWFFATGRGPVRARHVGYVLVFPIVWIVYTLLRGPLVTDPFTHAAYWYPYPFINPETSTGGYLSVTAYMMGIAVTTIAVASLLAWDSRRRAPTLG